MFFTLSEVTLFRVVLVIVYKVRKTERRAILEYLTLKRLRDEIEFSIRKIYTFADAQNGLC